jgi:hypothetical protein
MAQNQRRPSSVPTSSLSAEPIKTDHVLLPAALIGLKVVHGPLTIGLASATARGDPMAYLDHGLDRLGAWLARRLDAPTPHELSYVPNDMRVMSVTLQPGDVILVDGRSMVATAIKYLTQSTWSHAAIWVGDALGGDPMNPDAHCLVESNLGEGCVSAPLSKYHHVSMRICRPSGLSAEDRAAVVAHVISRIGIKYDTGALAPQHDRAWLGRADTRDLLHLDCTGVRKRALSDPAARRAGDAAGLHRLPNDDGGDPAHPPPQPLYAARFRHLTLLRRDQTRRQRRLQLPPL